MTRGTDELALDVRTGLPEPLRVLLEPYPRRGWESHPHFTALTRFWLDRHLLFRRVQTMLVSETEEFLDAGREPQGYGGGLARLAGMFLNELHGHHMIEDMHYFPLLKGLDARIAAGFDLLDADHHALDGEIRGLAEDTNAVLAALRGGQPALAAGALHGRLLRFGRLLDRHLTDEEELVVPVILDHPEAGL
jgi:iron-sulfur cluster repair protein YtfE (RIC family)